MIDRGSSNIKRSCKSVTAYETNTVMSWFETEYLGFFFPSVGLIPQLFYGTAFAFAVFELNATV